MPVRTLDGLAVAGKRVLLRADLNVPVRDGTITDRTRIERVLPTIRELAGKGARVIVCSHFDRPKGKRRARHVARARWPTAMAEVLGRAVGFADDCVGPVAEAAVAALHDGDILVLENTRFHTGEEANDPAFAAAARAARRPLRQRCVFRRPPRPCQHRGRRPPAALPTPAG